MMYDMNVDMSLRILCIFEYHYRIVLQFIELVISGNIRPHERHLHELQNEMREMGFEDDPVKKWKGEKADLSYLTNMPMSRLTVSEVHEFRVQLNSIYEKLNRVAALSWQDAWLTDLQVLEKEGYGDRWYGHLASMASLAVLGTVTPLAYPPPLTSSLK
ncbi:unnamed protein product [Angiostrongylus costaricensis]|uniref:Retrotransposon gag protein n=1 Tax=Angiostrongylus costaricensis TaxID=334426 RepID=A0A158PLT9_ANGCS|nr:unnamed protein product [Angiostrongylus costaricensis]